MPQLRQGTRVREQPQPLDGRHQAALRSKPAEGTHPRGQYAQARLRVHALPESGEGDEGSLSLDGARGCLDSRSDRRSERSPRAGAAASSLLQAADAPPSSEADRRVAVSDTNLLRFRVAVAGALAHLESRRQEVNDLNVFPVADGDTGDNMALTLKAVLDELDRLQGNGQRTIDEIGREEIVQSVKLAALLVARGNSGVILSQLIRGGAEELVSRPGQLI